MKLKIVAVALFTTALASGAVAETKREGHAHEHGHGKLNVAIEGKNVMMEMEVPGADIVGFEHEAKSDEDKAKVADAMKILGAPETLFMVAESAKCETKKAEIEVHGHGDHNEFHGTYQLMCENPGDIKGIKFGMFGKFPNLEELEVKVVTESGQSAYEVEKDEPQLVLK